MRIQEEDPIEGVCNQNELYTLFDFFDGQEEAVCPVSEEEILQRLNSELTFLKDNPNHKDKGSVALIINCKGELVRCKMSDSTKSIELDDQIIAVFNSLGEWKVGKLNRTDVDSSVSFYFKIKKGVVFFDS